ncbi:MAG TPA: hypothetical protein DDX92_05830 [Flavobacteriales bacterium]|jgi:hypothetical protein|nr:hypothetical protein [Flavobacteriales bacterium]
MNFVVLSAISFLIPAGVSAVGILSILANRFRGRSRLLLVLMLVSLLAYFIANLIFKIEFAAYQLWPLVILIPLWMLSAPLFYSFVTSLLEDEVVGKKINWIWHIILPVVSFIIAIIAALLFTNEEIIDIVSESSKSRDTFSTGIARGIFVAVHLFWFLQWLVYFRLLDKLFKKQKRVYNIFYGSYETRNEDLYIRMKFLVIIMTAMDLLVWVFLFVSPSWILSFNLLFGILTALIIISGREQVDMKKYRMYKLNSHHHEVEFSRK